MARRRVQLPGEDDIRSNTARAKQRKTGATQVSSESQQMLAVGSMLSMPPRDAEDLNHLREKISQDRKNLKGLLDRRVHQAETAQGQRLDAISSALSAALHPQDACTQDTPPSYPGSMISTNLSSRVLDTVLAASGDLLGEYSRLNKVIAGLHDGKMDSDNAMWEKEVQATGDNLRKGARVALKRVNRALGASQSAKDEGIEGTTVDDESEGVNIEKDEEDLELFKSLNYAQRGVRRMVKGMEGNED